MQEDSSKDWSAKEEQALSVLRNVPPPNAGMKSRVRDSLREAGLLSGSPAGVTPPRFFTGRTIVACAASLVLGLALGMAGHSIWSPSPGDGGDGMTGGRTFLLLLQSGDAERLLPGELERRVQEYGDWYRLQVESGKALAGHKLRSGGFRVTRSGAQPVDTRQEAGSVEGFFLLRAADYDEAVSRAKTCPHSRYGGLIEVREVDR